MTALSKISARFSSKGTLRERLVSKKFLLIQSDSRDETINHMVPVPTTYALLYEKTAKKPSCHFDGNMLKNDDCERIA